MPTLSTLAFPRNRMPHLRPGPSIFLHKLATVPITGAGSAIGDDIVLATLPAGMHVVDGWLQVAGTLGTSCTVQLRVNTTAISAASTAAAINNLRIDKPVVADLINDRSINIIVAGAAITVSAVISLWLELFEYRPLAV